MMGSRNTGTPTNNATVALYNNSAGPQYLVVRSMSLVAAANQQGRFAFTQGQTWTVSGSQIPIIPTEAALPGTIGSVDTATNFGQFFPFTAASGYWTIQQDIPFCILPPGWALIIQLVTAAQSLNAGIVWETIFAEELDFLCDMWPS
jgi:hypothetical protein